MELPFTMVSLDFPRPGPIIPRRREMKTVHCVAAVAALAVWLSAAVAKALPPPMSDAEMLEAADLVVDAECVSIVCDGPPVTDANKITTTYLSTLYPSFSYKGGTPKSIRIRGYDEDWFGTEPVGGWHQEPVPVGWIGKLYLAVQNDGAYGKVWWNAMVEDQTLSKPQTLPDCAGADAGVDAGAADAKAPDAAADASGKDVAARDASQEAAAVDASARDAAARDASEEAAAADASARDATARDAGVMDAAVADASLPDKAATDAPDPTDALPADSPVADGAAPKNVLGQGGCSCKVGGSGAGAGGWGALALLVLLARRRRRPEACPSPSHRPAPEDTEASCAGVG
jgi:MYXO-CTERM domain-containing protein